MVAHQATRTYEAKHVDKRRQSADHERVPPAVRLVQQRVHRVRRQARNRDICDVAERQLVISVGSASAVECRITQECNLLLRLFLVLTENVFVWAPSVSPGVCGETIQLRTFDLNFVWQ